MEEIKNGVISEEALDKIAGGLNINKNKVVRVLKKVGIAIYGATAITTALGAVFVGGAFVQRDTDMLGNVNKALNDIKNRAFSKKTNKPIIE